VSQLSFVSPIFLFALLVVPATLTFLVLMSRRRTRYPVLFTNLDVLASVVGGRRPWRTWLPVGLLLLALATAATAVAGPRVRLSVPEQNATIVLLVDVSGSMRANDVQPSRLDAAVDAMRTFMAKVPKGVNVGLVAFSSSPEVLSPPTTDREVIANGLGYLTPEAATALSAGLDTATQLVVRSLAAKGVHHDLGHFLPAAIILESDGSQNRGSITPLQAAQHAKAAGVRVYGVALGTPHGTVEYDYGPNRIPVPVPPDPGVVRAISRITGGKAYTARTADRLDQVYRDLGTSIGRKIEQREITSWLAAATAFFLLTAVGSSRIWSTPLP
jgi:Ca-activated chloride channel homolog